MRSSGQISAAASEAAKPTSLRIRLRDATTTRLRWGFVGLAVALYLVMLAVEFKAIVTVASWNADNANMLNLGRELRSLADGQTVELGNAPNYSTLVANAGLDWLFGSTTLLEIAPACWYVVATALLVAGIWRATDRQAALSALVVLICLNPVSLELVTSHAVHGATWFAASALGGYVTVVARGSGRHRIRLALAVVAGIIAGTAAASDPLAMPVAVLPLLVTAGWLWYRRHRQRRHLASEMIAFIGSSLLGGLALRSLGRGLGVRADLPDPTLATLGQSWGNVLQSAQNVMQFFGPAPFGARMTLLGVGQTLIGLLGIVGIWFVLRKCWHVLDTHRPTSAAQAAAPSAIWLYWGSSVAFGLLAVLTSPLAFEVAASSLRYEFNLFLAGAVAVPSWLASRKQGTLLLPVTLAAIALVSTAGVWATRDERDAALNGFMIRSGGDALAYAEQQGADRGYAGYWNAGPLRWHTGVPVIPLENCDLPGGPGVCRSQLAVPESILWPPRSSAKVFVVVDPSFPGALEEQRLTGWERRETIGGLTVFVFPKDIEVGTAP